MLRADFGLFFVRRGVEGMAILRPDQHHTALGKAGLDTVERMHGVAARDEKDLVMVMVMHSDVNFIPPVKIHLAFRIVKVVHVIDMAQPFGAGKILFGRIVLQEFVHGFDYNTGFSACQFSLLKNTLLKEGLKKSQVFLKIKIEIKSAVCYNDFVKLKKWRKNVKAGSIEQRKKKRGWTDPKRALVILAPMILWWFLAAGFPMLFGFVLGFFEWRGINPQPKFIWFENFVTFFKNSLYREILWRTIWLGVVTTAGTVLCGFGAALLMNMPLKGRGAFRSLWYIPAVTSTVAISQVIQIMIDPFNGVLTRIFNANGWTPINFVDSATWGYIVIIFYSIWKGVGGSALLWLAGLQCIDASLYEAAEMDGANTFQKFLHITLPGLRPIVTYIVITGIIGALQIYEPVAFITNGGPQNGTMVLALKIVKDGFFNFNFGMAGASSLILAIIIFVCSASYYLFSKRRANDA